MSQREKRKRNTKILILTAAAILAAVCGVWMLQSPSRERQAVYDGQEALLYEIMQDIIAETDENGLAYLDCYAEPAEYPSQQQADAVNGTDAGTATTTSDENPDTHEADFTEVLTEGELPALTDIEAPYTPNYENGEYEAFYFEPLPDRLFPNAIQGIGILTIERINLTLPIAEGVEYATLCIAPGRVTQTAQIGEIGNAVIAGHRNYAFGSMFNRLGELEIGDIVQYQARNGEMMEFVVFEIAVIEPHDQIAFLQPVNDSIITLYTCTPIRTATHRLIIRAQRIY